MTTAVDIAQAIHSPREPSLTFAQLRKANVARCGESFHPLDAWSALEWAGAMCGEAGEAANCAKKLKRIDDTKAETVDAMQSRDRDEHRINMAIEIADNVIYADLLAAREGISLEEAIRIKFNLTSEQVGSKHKL